MGDEYGYTPPASAGVSDHGALTGLGDDDHTIYAKKASNLSDLASAATARTNLGVAPPPTLTASGFYMVTGSSGAASTTLTSNRLYYIPIQVPRTTTFDRIAISHAATTAGAGSVVRLGIYNNSNDRPGSLLLDAGTVDLTTAAGLKTITISQQLTPGIWWLAAVAQVTSGSPTFTTSAPYIPCPAGDVTNNGVLFQNSVTGTLPDPSVPASAQTTGGPVIYLRAA